LQTQGRWVDRQFEDDENTLTLGAAGVLDLRVEGQLTARTTLTLALDNVTDAAVPVARAANGLTSYGTPRTWRAGLHVDW
jgi:outer membrane receptor protein involved in Fe transport